MAENTEHEEKDQNEGTDQNENQINENDTFHVDFEDEEAVDSDWLDSLDGKTDIDSQKEENEEENENEEEKKDNDDSLDFEEKENEEENEKDSLDVKAFNKKLGKNFQSEKELLDFLKEKDSGEEVENDDKIIENSTAAIDYYSPLLKYNDKDLMLEQGKAKAIQDGKDINDPEVQEAIEDEVQGMIDSYDLSVKASALRDKLKDLVKDAADKKSSIENKREQAKVKSLAQEKEQLQNSFATIHSNKTFYGVNTNKETITRAYKYAQSGKFLEELKADPSKLAEAAMLMEMKKEIHKKSSGLSYNDGIAAALDDYEKSKDDKSIIKAQENGTSGSSNNSEDFRNAFIQ